MKTAVSTLDTPDMLADAPVGRASDAKPLRILYAAGYGDILGTYGHWKNHRDDPKQLSKTYSGQFFDVCQRRGYLGFVLTYDAHVAQRRDDRFIIRQRALPKYGTGPAPLYHLEQLGAALVIMFWALRWRVDVLVVASGSCHWFALGLLRLWGVKIVPTLHCVLWPKYRRPGRIARMITRLDAWFFSRAGSTIMTTSHDVDDQLVELLGEKKVKARLRLVPFLPSYRAEDFPLSAPPATATTFRVFYAGRIEPEKGVFDLVAMGEALTKMGRTDIEFDICGTGSALEEMKRRTQAAGIDSRFRFHGHCERPVMLQMYQRCHVVIVPTTTRFVEGFNQVVAEGIMAGRPVVTSSVCPAVRYIGDAAVAVPPDDVPAYIQAILKLADDRSFYDHCAAKCQEIRDEFFDESRGWGAALDRAVNSLYPQVHVAGN